MMFYSNNYNIISFFSYINNELEILYIFIKVYDLYYILLYVSINFLIYDYIFFTQCLKIHQ
jgi:hypothetical protein